MKFPKQFIAMAALLFGLAAGAQQKGETQLDIQFNAALPQGSLKNIVSDNSYRGVKASILYGISSNLAVGLGTGFQDFYQKYPREVYHTTDGSDLSAVRSFSAQTIPVLATARWNFSPAATVRPYAAIGVGGNLVSYSDYVGQFTTEQKTKFGFAARPEAGVFIPFRKGGESGVNVGASYNIMPFKSSEVSNLNHIGIHAGFSLPMRK